MGSPATPAIANEFETLGVPFDPFAADSMPAFFFVGGQRRYFVQRAVHLLYFTGAMVLLLGPSGAGKTRLLHEVETELRDLADISRIEATVLMDGAQLRSHIAAAIGLLAGTGGGVNSAAEFAFALSQNRPGDEDPLPVVLLIDSAHLLSIETLAETATLVQGSGGRLRLLLAGEFDLAASWQQANVGAVEVLQLPALDREETADYLHTRLLAAGANRGVPFESAVLDELYAQSGGNIGAIHSLAPQLMRPAATESTSVVARAKALPALHIGLIAALLAGVIVLVLYRGHGDTQTEPKSAESGATAGNQNSVPLTLPGMGSNTAAARPAQPPASTVARAPVAATQAPVPKPELQIAEQPRPAPKIAPPPVVPETKPDTAPEPAVKSAKESVAINYPADESELLALPAQQVMLQLLGAGSRATVDKFKASAGRGERLWVYHTQLRGKPWFIVLTGPYPSKEAAQAAVAKMPEALRKQQPWPRSVANVQADIRAHPPKP